MILSSQIFQNQTDSSSTQFAGEAGPVLPLAEHLRRREWEMNEDALRFQPQFLREMLREIVDGVAEIRSRVIRNLRRDAVLPDRVRPAAERKRGAIGGGSAGDEGLELIGGLARFAAPDARQNRNQPPNLPSAAV